MKISKSKQELARIISENGGWRDGGDADSKFAAQQDDGEVWFSSTKPEWNTGRGCFAMGYEDHFTIGRLISNRHQTILSRAEYFHLYPAPDADGWIEWGGGECPVGDDIGVSVRFRSGKASDKVRSASEFYWKHDIDRSDIVAYRLHKPEQAKPEFCESVMRSIPDVETKPTIEQLAADYRNAKDYAERKQQEADDAKADADAKLKALEIAGEAIGLLVSPITEKQEPELAAVVKVGDEVECVESNIKRDKYNGMVGRLHTIDESDTSTTYLVDFGGNAKIWCHEVKFIRRL